MPTLTMPLREPELAKALLEGMGMQPVRPEQAVLLEPLPADPWEFGQRCCFTYDQRAAEFGRKVIERFPNKAHLELFMRAIVREPRLMVEKSVQIMISWAVAVWALHDVLTNRGHDGAWFCLDRGLASKHLEERVYRLYLSIPAVYAKPRARIVGGNFEVYHDDDSTLPTSSITAMAQETSEGDKGAKRTTGWAWTWALMDEGARTRKVEEIVATLQNRCGKIIMPSSVDGPSTFHHRVGYAKSLAPEDAYRMVEPELLPGSEGRPMHGVKCWRRFGWFCMEIRYAADPEKDPQRAEGQAWWNHPATEAARALSAKWNRDMECDASVMAGNPVWSDTQQIDSGPQGYFAHLVMVRGHDYSYLYNVALAGQLQWRGEGAARRPLLVIFREIVSESSYILPHKTKILQVCREEYGADMRWIDFGDYSANEHTPQGVLIEAMRPEISLITVPTGPGGVRKRTNLVQYVISQGMLAIVKEACPMLWQAVTSGYVLDANGEAIGGEKGRPWADFADPLGYIVSNLFELHPSAAGGTSAVLKPNWLTPITNAPDSRQPSGDWQERDGVILPYRLQR